MSGTDEKGKHQNLLYNKAIISLMCLLENPEECSQKRLQSSEKLSEENYSSSPALSCSKNLNQLAIREVVTRCANRKSRALREIKQRKLFFKSSSFP